MDAVTPNRRGTDPAPWTIEDYERLRDVEKVGAGTFASVQVLIEKLNHLSSTFQAHETADREIFNGFNLRLRNLEDIYQRELGAAGLRRLIAGTVTIIAGFLSGVAGVWAAFHAVVR